MKRRNVQRKHNQTVSQVDTLKGRMNGSKKLTIHINNRRKTKYTLDRNATAQQECTHMYKDRHDQILVGLLSDSFVANAAASAVTPCAYIHDRLSP